ncbi:hypothetical protein E4U55_007175 [Claviceps digitariae]|nr:hypothetical protein E4U55_007175 [Claviceps digitariae]
MAASAASSLRTLVRPSILPSTPRLLPTLLVPRARAAEALFSTSSRLAATPPPALKSRRELPQKVKKNYRKKSNIVSVKKPNPGERKAFRKRIQLSNNSALPVKDTKNLRPETLADEESRGKMVAIPDEVVDQLRALEAFKATQTWNLFRRPHFLVRNDTCEVVRHMKEAAQLKEGYGCVLRGTKLSGKSLVLLQTMAYGLMNGWVVLHIPEGQDLTNGNTEFSPIEGTEPMQFAQPVYCLKLLQNIYKANQAVLERLSLKQAWPRLGSDLKKGASTLADLVLAAKESDSAWPTLNAFWTELTLKGRPPVLFTLDGLAHLNRVSDYRDPSFKPIHAHDLALVRLFIDALSRKTSFPNGGFIVAATSDNNTYHHPSQELALAQLEAKLADRQIPKPDPYERGYDDRVSDSLKEVSHLFHIGGLSMDEARVLMEYWGASGMLRTVLDSRTVAEKWTLSGHGIVGEMERASLMTMRM